MSKLILPDDLRPMGDIQTVPIANRQPDTEECVFAPSDIANSFTFFNHGVFFTHGGFAEDQDPVGDWYVEQRPPPQVFKQNYGKPIFEGLDALTFDNRVPWNNILCAVPNEHWGGLLEHLAGIVVHDYKKKSIGLAYYGKLEILDPTFSVLDPRAPKIQCYVFCLSTNSGRYEFVRPSPLSRPPKLVNMPATDFAVAAGKAANVEDTDLLVQRLNPAHAAFHRKYREVLERGPLIEGVPE